jgi:hypothetical protein
MIENLFLVAGIAVLSIALRSLHNRLCHRLGTIGVFVTSFLAGWLIGGHWWLGLLFAATWLFLPWLEILTRVRKMRLPVERRLVPCRPPTRSIFPHFAELTEEIEGAGFEFVDDLGWDYLDQKHFYRLFHNPEKRLQAALCLCEQSDMAFFYVSVSSRSEDGREFTTWNYPFSPGIHQSPGKTIHVVEGDIPIDVLLDEQESHLRNHGLGFASTKPFNPETFGSVLEQELREQIFHNIDRGLLVLEKRENGELFRYSVRGWFFLWFQFLRDLVRLS